YQLSYAHHGPRSWTGGRRKAYMLGDDGPNSNLRGELVRDGRLGDARRGGPCGGRVGPGLGREQHLAVVAQLVDRLEDVGQRAVPALLLRRREVDARVPPAGELLDRRDVDDPVV